MYICKHLQLVMWPDRQFRSASYRKDPDNLADHICLPPLTFDPHLCCLTRRFRWNSCRSIHIPVLIDRFSITAKKKTE